MPSSTAAVSTAAASSSSTAAVSTAAASSSTAVPYWQVVCTGVAYSALAPAISCVLTNPMDVAKTRLNMDRELRPPGAPRAFAGIVDCIRQAWAAEGLAGVQRGLGFAVVREASKNAFRLGLYDPLEAALDTRRRSSAEATTTATAGVRPGVPMSTRVAAGATTGAVAALVCNPLDLCKSRLQLSPGHASVAGSASSAMRAIVDEGGLASLWTRGAAPNIARSCVATSVALPVNAQLKELANRLDALRGRPAVRDAACALGSSVVTTFAINPLDLVRVRLFAQPSLEGGQLYRGTLDCAWRVATTEGLLAFWKGSAAAFWRIGPHQTLTFTLIGWMRRMEQSWREGG